LLPICLTFLLYSLCFFSVCIPLTNHALHRRVPRELQVNTFLYMSYTYAKGFNSSSCWVCAHIPIHPRGGIPFRPIPLNESEVIQWVLHQNTSGTRTRDGSTTAGGSYHVNTKGEQGDWKSSGNTLIAFSGWYQPHYNRTQAPPFLTCTNISGAGRLTALSAWCGRQKGALGCAIVTVYNSLR